MIRLFLLFLLVSLPAYSQEDYSKFLPNKEFTPGDPLIGLNPAETICIPGYTKKARVVSESTKRKVFELYNTTPQQDRYEVDHLISLELGGSNDIRNLWPQSYTTQPWNAYKKDKLENKLKRMVCSGQIQLEQAQQEIANDWIAAYKKYIGE
jgi:hypothetical protein